MPIRTGLGAPSVVVMSLVCSQKLYNLLYNLLVLQDRYWKQAMLELLISGLGTASMFFAAGAVKVLKQSTK